MQLEGTKHYSKPKQKTVDDVFKLWFDIYTNEVKDSSTNKVISTYQVHIKPWFGDDYIDQISSEKF
ncbi:hypothetical protein [Lactobacillus melliventris]|uniref:Integrase SAM-like N-terminal domain-containing protein n=1 Tax=Lactobacillus melliventris TaxID=1218507 RepID=A0ABX5N158_9LACO|nr:hypothetical protein [Lactobacillus melliventris]PXY84862.1 hypothetical protein DK873_06880 [Lactobacillus melliventris]